MRRLWECPDCGRRERTGGAVVNRLCPCGERADPPRQVWMRLLEGAPQSKPEASEGQPADGR